MSAIRIKSFFDASCLVAAAMTVLFPGLLKGLGVGTALAALTMGKGVGMVGGWLSRQFMFEIHRYHAEKIMCTDFHKHL